MENQFEDGDIVQLASGGPDMTVERLSKPLLSTDVTKAECQWFGGRKLEHGWFPVRSLKLIKKSGEK
jgi:uncharacterized protein YodC (DUF2158 family)